MKHLLLTASALLLAVTAMAAPPAADLPLPRPFVQPVKNAPERIARLAARPGDPGSILAIGILRSLSGQHEDAAKTLAQAKAGLPAMSGWARAFAGYSLYRLGRFDDALAELDGLDTADAAFGPEALLLSAYCLEGLGSPEALPRYRRFLDLGDHSFRSVALWRAAELAAVSGDFAGAGEHLRELLTTLPWTGSAEKAEPLARELSASGRIAFNPGSAAALRERIELLLDKSMAQRAAPLIEQYAKAPGADPARALYLQGKALYSRRDTTAAIQHFEDAASTAADPVLAAWAVYHQARAYWRFSGPDDAARMESLLLDSLARARRLPDSAELAEACLRLTMLSRLERARFGEALAAAAELAASGPEPTESREQAAWLAGLIRHAQGDHAGAVSSLASFMERFPNSDYAPAARYWSGRAMEAAGDKEKAAASYSAVLSRWPNGYYGMLAKARLGARAAVTAQAGACPDFAALAPPEAARPALERAAVLEAGLLPELAERELAAANAAMPKDPALAVRYAALSTSLGNHLTAVRAVSRALWGCLARGTGAELGPIREIVYPNRHPDLIDRNLAGTGVDPNLIRGLIRQESFFEPDAVSGAGAVGLMQMMPATAKSQAEKYGEKGFKVDSLKDPAVNIRFGVRYFLERHQEYGGNVALTLASYNAGRVKLSVWKEFLGGLDPELFVEFIPYTETRDYVKRILGNEDMYAKLY